MARVVLQPGASPTMDPRLFSAIPSRLTNRNLYEGRAIADADLITLQSSGMDKDIRTSLVTDSTTKKKFLDLTVRADQIQYSDANFKSELGHWLSQGGMGPTGIQAKIDQMEVVFLDNGPDQIRTDTELINSTPYLGFISTRNNDSKSPGFGRTGPRASLACGHRAGHEPASHEPGTGGAGDKERD